MAEKTEKKKGFFAGIKRFFKNIAKFFRDTRSEMKKYCRFCRKHTLHRETK